MKKRLFKLMICLGVSFAGNTQTYLNEGFEGATFPANWTNLDENGDGFWWKVWINASTAHSGNNFAGSYSYNQNGALTPDNWMITPRLTVTSLTDSIAYWVATQDASYPAEHYAVLVSTTGLNPADFTTTLYEATLTAADNPWKRKAFSLEDFVGDNIYIAFRHYNCTDNFQIKIDDVSGPQLYCPATTATITETACLSYTSPSGDHTWTTSGTYTDVLPNQAGCDSVITINLTINTPNVSVTQNGASLSADVLGASYQWLNCNTGNSVVNGATARTFNPTANGSYSVIVTINGCSDTSACYTVSTVGIGELENSIVSVSPNPATDKISVRTQVENPEFVLFNNQGQFITIQTEKNADEFIINLSELPSGIYFLNIQSEFESKSVKVVKH